MPRTQPYEDPVWRLPFTRRPMPWRLYLFLWALRKRLLLCAMNVRYRCRLGWRIVDRRKLCPGTIPVIVNNFNRLEPLRTLVDWLGQLTDPVSIIILDNASTYPPLLEYYATLSQPNIQVARLGYNSGLEGIEDAVGELSDVPFYVVTDPDLVPYPDTPRDMLSHMRHVLEAHPELSHVGAALEIDDLPPCYPLRDEVREWEARYWPPQAQPVGEHAYAAWVDTTFAMYRRGCDVSCVEPAARLKRPYRLQHVDWYTDPADLSEEQQYYRQRCGPVASWAKRDRQPG